MTEEQLKLNQAVLANGSDASYLINHPAFNKAFSQVAQAYQDLWFATQDKETDRRELLWTKLQVMKEIKELLINQIEQAEAVGLMVNQ